MGDKICEEFEKSGWTKNPFTGRVITPHGKVAKKLREGCGITKTLPPPPKKRERVLTKTECDAFRANPDINPLTKRRIVPGKASYKALLKACEVESALRRVMKYSGSPSPAKKPETRQVVPKDRKKTQRAPKASAPKKFVVKECYERGFMQTSQTCWFNSVINALMMSSRIGNHIKAVLKELPAEERKRLGRSGEVSNSCPVRPGASHVLKYAFRYYAGLHHLMTPTKKDRAYSAVAAVMHSPEQRSIQKIGKERGFHPQRATKAILGSFFKPDEFLIAQWHEWIPLVGPNTKIISFQVPAENGQHYGVRDATIKRTSSDRLYHGGKVFHLAGAVMAMAFERGFGHAVALYKCGGFEYLYDSNDHNAYNFNWSRGITGNSLKTLEMLYKNKYGPFKSITFSVEFYSV